MNVIRVRRLSGKRKWARVHEDPPRSMKLWQFKLPLLLLLRLQLKHLSLDMPVTYLGAIGAVITIVFLAHAERGSASDVSRRATLLKTTKHHFNKPIKLPDQVPNMPAIGAV